MAKRPVADCHEMTYEMETFKDDDYKVGCDDGPHQEAVEWIQCTDQGCDVWYCLAWVKKEFDLRDAEIAQLKEDAELFKCHGHGLYDVEFDKLGNKQGNVRKYNLRKKQKLNSLKDLSSDEDDDLKAMVQATSKKSNKKVSGNENKLNERKKKQKETAQQKKKRGIYDTS